MTTTDKGQRNKPAISSAVGVTTRQLSGCMSFEELLTCNLEVAIEYGSN